VLSRVEYFFLKPVWFSYNDSVSNVFPCLNGVRQGENLSLFLFALYLNDLDTFLTSKNAQRVKSISEDFENDLQIYVKLFTILYADDTVLLTESAEELQLELNYFYEHFTLYITHK
jgi:hypothetical protein